VQSFIFQGLPSRVVFGWGALDTLPEEIAQLGATRALVLTTPGQREQGEQVAGLLGERAVGVYSEAVMHVPVEVAEAARAEAARAGADCYVAVGGGSTIGLGKAIALQSGQPILAVPTTYAGSEMTPIYGITAAGLKRTGRDFKVLPRSVVYDPALTLTLPADLSASSGVNAIAHAVEALYSEDLNPIIQWMATESIRALEEALPVITRDPSQREARSRALYGAWLAGTCLGSSSMGLHHKLCHTLGGTYNLPHAETHSVVLPHAAHYNHRAAPAALAAVARALGARADSQAELAAQAGPLLFALNRRLELPSSLEALGLPESGIVETAHIASDNPYKNPEPVVYGRLRALLDRAWHGQPPA